MPEGESQPGQNPEQFQMQPSPQERRGVIQPPPAGLPLEQAGSQFQPQLPPNEGRGTVPQLVESAIPVPVTQEHAQPVQSAAPGRGEVNPRSPLTVDPNVYARVEGGFNQDELRQMHDEFMSKAEARNQLVDIMQNADQDLVLTPEQRRMVTQELFDYRLRVEQAILERVSPGARNEIVEAVIGKLLDDIRPMANDYTLVYNMVGETKGWSNSLGGRVEEPRQQKSEQSWL